MSISHSITTIAYDGTLLKEGQMDVRDLAPSLLALDEVCRLSHNIISNSNRGLSVSVKIDKFRKGSFEIDMIIAVFREIDNLFTTEYESSHELLSKLGLVMLGVGGTMGVMELIKRLKGKDPTDVDIKQNNVIINQNINVSKDTWNIYNDHKVREGLGKFVSPLEKKGIDHITIKQNGQKIRTIDKNDLPYFTEYDFDEKIHTRIQRLELQVDAPHITEASKKWWFSTLDKKPKRFQASIIDKEYLKRTENAEVSFQNGIRIRADLLTRTIKQNDKETYEYEIDNVEHDTGQYDMKL